MKFKDGDATGIATSGRFEHEFLRRMDTFEDLAASAKTMIMQENRVQDLSPRMNGFLFHRLWF
jgi:hypothetical protein